MKKIFVFCCFFAAVLLWQGREQAVDAQPKPFECPWTPVTGVAPFVKGCYGGGSDGCGSVTPGKCPENWPKEPETPHADATAAVATAIARLKAAGHDLRGKNCGKIVEVACSIMGDGAGLMVKPSGLQYNGHALDIIAFPDGYIYNVIEGCTNGTGGSPKMDLTCCGKNQSQGGKGTCKQKYLPCTCTLGPLCGP